MALFKHIKPWPNGLSPWSTCVDLALGDKTVQNLRGLAWKLLNSIKVHASRCKFKLGKQVAK